MSGYDGSRRDVSGTELSSALRGRADRLNPEPPAYDAIAARSRHRRMRRRGLAGGGVAAMVALVLALTGLPGLSGGRDTIEPPPAGPPSPTDAPTPTGTAPAASSPPGDDARSAAYPKTFVGVRDHRIAVFAADDGHLVRYLSELPESLAPTASHPVLAAKAGEVFYTHDSLECPSQIRRVLIEGSQRQGPRGSGHIVVDTDQAVGGVAITPDGRWLAWLHGGCSGGNDIMLQRQGGPEHHRIQITGRLGAPPLGVPPVALSPDGTRVAVQVRTGMKGGVRVVPTTANDVMADGESVGCATHPPCRTKLPAFTADGSLTYLSGRSFQVALIRRSHDGKSQILRPIEIPYDDVRSLDVDPSGRHILLGTTGGTYRWSVGTDDLVKIAEENLSPTW